MLVKYIIFVCLKEISERVLMEIQSGLISVNLSNKSNEVNNNENQHCE